MKWDVVMWIHGPEHIEKSELADTLRNIESYTRYLVVLGCPWGVYKQGKSYGNPYEVHRAYLYPEDFLKLRYKVESIGAKDTPGSNLTAWKHL